MPRKPSKRPPLDAPPADARSNARPPARPNPDRSPPRPRRDIFLADGVRIAHEDPDLIVIDKPSGLLTVDTLDENRDNVFALVKRHVREHVKRRGTKVWVIHRLDKEASGLVAFAKSEDAFKLVKEDLRAKRVLRIYFAVVEGELPAKQVGDIGVIHSFLQEGEDGIVRAVPAPAASRPVTPQRDDAKLAVTHYRVRAIGNGRTLLELKLDTGRKNQIRAHLAQIGTPIVGDRRYGASSDPIGRVCLHAQQLMLPDHRSGQPLDILSPLPDSFLKLVGAKLLTDPPPPSRHSVEPAPAPLPTTPQTSWDHVAEWYDNLVGERRSDHHDALLIPGALRLLAPAPGQRILDLACGQGVLARALADTGADVVGVDAAPRLIAAAQKASPPTAKFVVGDARTLPALELGLFDHVACVMALMNIDPLEPVMRGIAASLKPGGSFVAILLHPAFRTPGQTSWGWAPLDGPKDAESGGPRAARRHTDHNPGTTAVRQYRRVDGYLSPGQSSVVMNPGEAAKGREKVVTLTYHRPLQTYIRAFSDAHLLVDALEEWPSLRTSEPGPRAAEENRARREIPMFVALRAIKIAPSQS